MVDKKKIVGKSTLRKQVPYELWSIVLLLILLGSVSELAAQEATNTQKVQVDQVEPYYVITYQDPEPSIPLEIQQIQGKETREQATQEFLSQPYLYQLILTKSQYAFAPVDEARKEEGVFEVKGTHSYFIDLEERTEYSVFNYFGMLYTIKSLMKRVPWTLEEEEREINGLRCRKATWPIDDEALVEVWYAPDIPLPCGPMGYWNTPGLIVDFSLRFIQFEIVSIEKSSEPLEIRFEPQGRSISKRDFDKMMKRDTEKYSTPVKEGGTTRQITVTKGDKEIYSKTIRE